MDVLPPELQHLIFKSLPNIKTIALDRRVCREWKEFIDANFNFGFEMVAIGVHPDTEEAICFPSCHWRKPHETRYFDPGEERTQSYQPEGVCRRELSWIAVFRNDYNAELLAQFVIYQASSHKAFAEETKISVLWLDGSFALELDKDSYRNLCVAFPEAKMVVLGFNDREAKFVSEENFAVSLEVFPLCTRMHLAYQLVPSNAKFTDTVMEIHRRGQITEFLINCSSATLCGPAPEDILCKVQREEEEDCSSLPISALRIDNVEISKDLNPAVPFAVGDPVVLFVRCSYQDTGFQITLIVYLQNRLST